MAGKETAVFGIVPTRTAAEHCVDVLLAAGYRGDDISVLAPDLQSTKELATEKNIRAPEGAIPEEANTSAIAGGAIGGTLGLLAGVGALAIPGLGPFIAAGPIMGALAGVGALAGGLMGALIGMGIPEDEAQRYERRVNDGSILVSVHCDDSAWVDKAKVMLKRTGGEDISSAVERAIPPVGYGP